MHSLEELVVSEFANLIVRFSKLSIILFFVTHWNACLFYGAGNYALSSTGHSWLSFVDIQDTSTLFKYISSLYWAFTTMMSVGYGDIHPITTYEREVAMICMLSSSMTFAFIIGDIGKLVGSFNELAA
jgi:hypothetical protein